MNKKLILKTFIITIVILLIVTSFLFILGFVYGIGYTDGIDDTLKTITNETTTDGYITLYDYDSGSVVTLIESNYSMNLCWKAIEDYFGGYK